MFLGEPPGSPRPPPPSPTAARDVRVCLMIEGQEGVSWEQWVALARACEETGIEGLFRSDHYRSVFEVAGRESLDAWATLAGLAAVTERQARDDGLARDVPA